MATPEELMWDIDTQDKIRNVTWWWWWWLFFIRNPNDPKRWKQLMILWSIKDTKKIKVMDHVWTPKGTIKRKDNSLEFPGMVCAWFYDGNQMRDPYLIHEKVFKSTWNSTGKLEPLAPSVVRSTKGSKGKKVSKVLKFSDFEKVGMGELKVKNEDNYIFRGTPNKYEVQFHEGDDKFNFIIEPISEFLSEPEFTFRKYVGKYGYTIYRIKGSELSGDMTVDGESEKISGSAYFQKIRLNSPAVPWYWTIFHFPNGGHLHYMIPHIGLPMFRKTEKPRSKLDWGELVISKTLELFDGANNKLYHFDKIKLKKDFTSQDLPIFNITGTNPEGQKIDLSIESYSRAYWRFEQRTTIKTRIFFYNEYPAFIRRLKIYSPEDEILVDSKDFEYNIGHCEHSWGRLA